MAPDMPRDSNGLRGPILCPIDFSDDSRRSLRYAIALAAGSASRVIALFVADPLLVAAAQARYRETSIAGTSLAELRRFVAAAIPAAARLGIEVEYRVTVGDSAAEIRAVARRVSCALIVMSTHGLGGFNKLILGSTTERLLRTTTIPVIAIPPRRRTRLVSWPGDRLLVPVVLGRHGAADVRAAASFARWFGASIILLHVVPPLQAPPWFRRAQPVERRQPTIAARRSLLAVAAHIPAGTRTHIRVLVGEPAHEIAALAKREDAGLIVMALRQSGGALGRHIGATVYHVLQHSRVPVLAVPVRHRRSR